MEAIKLQDMIREVAKLRETYRFDDDNTFVSVDRDELTRLPILILTVFDKKNNVEVTLREVVRTNE